MDKMIRSTNVHNAASTAKSGGDHEVKSKFLPKRIILVRHGESEGNKDVTVYDKIPAHKINLTPKGIEQAKEAGTKILDVVSEHGNSRNWKVYCYVSPYQRTRSTLSEIGKAIPKNRMIGVREECRIREQDFGNLEHHDDQKREEEQEKERNTVGKFFFRFPEGESGADVYDRVSGFLELLWRDINMKRLSSDPSDDLNIVIVFHGISIRVFLMEWFNWTVEQFEALKNPGNCEYRIMELGASGEYSLAINHDDKTLQEWGLSPEMIEDQKKRARTPAGSFNENSPFHLAAFFHRLADSDECGRNK